MKTYDASANLNSGIFSHPIPRGPRPTAKPLLREPICISSESDTVPASQGHLMKMLEAGIELGPPDRDGVNVAMRDSNYRAIWT